MKPFYSAVPLVGIVAAALCLGGCHKETVTARPTPPDRTTAGNALTCTPRPETLDYQFYPLGDNSAVIGDVMPYYDAATGQFNVYYLKDIWNDATHQRHPWYGLRTSNFYAYSGLSAGQILACSSNACQQDYALGTGHIIKKGSTYYAFYTGHNPNYPSGCVTRKEGIMLATAPGLNQPFSKNTSFPTIYAPTGQGFDEQDNFRDPFVYFDAASNTYYLIAAARKNVSGTWRGVVVKYTSADLLSWTYQGVLYDGGPTNFFMLETPELFKMGSTYYLLFSDIDSKNLFYRRSTALNGPWISPSGAARFEGKGIYAAKTALDQYGDRYLFGWTNRLASNSDAGAWLWGGNLVVHKLYQRSDQDLAVTIPHTLKSHVEAQSVALTKDSQWGNVTNVLAGTHSYTLSSPADKDVANVLFNPLAPTRSKLHCTVSYSSAAKDFGFLLGACDGYDDVYSLRFVPGQQRFSFDKVKRSQLTATTAPVTDVPFPMSPNTEYNVDIVFENSMVVVYLNNVAALSARIYRAPGTSWGIFADNSTATFRNITVRKP
jgi:beta-fructofuranosidase